MLTGTRGHYLYEAIGIWIPRDLGEHKHSFTTRDLPAQTISLLLLQDRSDLNGLTVREVFVR